ncbi:hypothetical protein BH10BDE1_BH10BDE1_31740 [soil metagenome]
MRSTLIRPKLKLAAFSFALLISRLAYGQALPFGAIGGEPLLNTFQIEVLGPSLTSERSDETVTHFRADAFIPISQSDVDAYAIQIRGTRLTLDKDRIPAGGVATIPKDLGSIAIGPFMRRKLESGDTIASDVQIGRSGTDLGSGSTATTVSANVFWGRPKDADGGQWIYLLSYSNSRSSFAGIPIPGFAYAKTFKTESSQGLWAAGAPFFFTMIRSQPWSATAFLSPFTAFVEGGYSLYGPFALFARFGWQPQGFKVNGGPSERVLFEEFRTTLGVRGPIARWAMATVGVAYSDGRRVAWGDSLTKSSSYESRLDDELTLLLSFSGRF